MSKVDDLIKELCPKGVASKAINSICNVSRGRVMSKDYLRDNAGEYPVYSSQTADNGVFGRIKTYDYDGEYLTWTTDGANAGSIFYRTGKFSITNVCGLLKISTPTVNAKYLAYILGTVAKKYVSSGMGNPKLMSNVMSAIKVPIPPLEVQKEIVNILDKFTQLEAELSAELSAELEARRKQYEYYRNQLLTFEQQSSAERERDLKWIKLGELLNYEQPGRYIVKSTEYDNKYPTPVLTAGQSFVLGKTNESEGIFMANKDTPVIIFDDFTTSNHWVDFDFKVKSSAMKMLKPKQRDDINFKFIYYSIQCIKYTAQDHARQWISKYSQFTIPIPSIREQNRVVDILDKFDKLVNDISEGLPAEIAARRQQYEYYRTKLLTFQELSS